MYYVCLPIYVVYMYYIYSIYYIKMQTCPHIFLLENRIDTRHVPLLQLFVARKEFARKWWYP